MYAISGPPGIDGGLAQARRRRVTRVVAAICVPLLFAGCGGKFNPRMGEDGIYRFADHPIEVRAPERCVLDAYVYDSPQMVEFVTGRGYWEAGGRYAVHVFPLPGEVVDRASFDSRAERFFQKFLVGEPGQYRIKVEPVSQSALTIADRPALRAIAVEKGRAVFVATARMHTTRISVASVLYPLDGTEAVDAQIPWACYDRFVDSVRETAPG